MDLEFNRLDGKTREEVLLVISDCKSSGEMSRRYTDKGDVYAYPHPQGGVSWGVNGSDGFCIARGVR